MTKLKKTFNPDRLQILENNLQPDYFAVLAMTAGLPETFWEVIINDKAENVGRIKVEDLLNKKSSITLLQEEAFWRHAATLYKVIKYL